ncbi:MAG: DUF1549 domain-containing protein [Planctomycetaceae bacterium]
MKPFLALLATTMLLTSPAFAGDPIASVESRYAEPSDEIPDFQKHVVPLLGRLGCNGRACHGSFKGQGGFRLSLFGYDFESDHEQIAGEDHSRIYPEVPEDSMLLTKPTLVDEHGGGKRLDVGSWQYNLLRQWIEADAQGREDKSLKLTRLEVTPSELIYDAEGVRTPLRAVAVWSDGTSEDVTALCRFQSNDPNVAEVDELGVVTSAQPGDTHIVVFYDGGVVPIPVYRPVSDRHGPRYPAIATRTKVDELVGEKLSKLGIVPSEICTDEEFLRRISLDMSGTLPPAWEVEGFLKDTSSDKRLRKIDELLGTPAYAAWWTTQLCDWTGNNPDFANQFEPGRQQFSEDWYDWIEQRVAHNVPYDEIVAGIVLSASREDDESYREFCENMVDVYAEDGEASFADRDTMPHYWARTNFRKAEDRAIGFAYSFLGIRIQCAQCHKHPFDQWTQDDFKNFEAFFTRVNYGNDRDTRDEYQKMLAELDTDGKRGGQLRNQLGKMLRDGTVIPLREVYVVEPRRTPTRRKNKKKNDNQNVPAAEGRVLGGETIDLNEYADPRQPLVDWLRSPENPYFARAFVNRVWATYFGVGIVDPVDDLSLANPPGNKALLDHLAEGFIASGYDMKWVHREIAGSDAYQRSWRPNETNREDEKNFSRAIHRRMPAEVAYDAVTLAMASDERIRELLDDPSQRAIGVAGSGARYRARIGRTDASFALTVFGRSIRESNCDCDKSADASLLQTVYLQNDDDVLRLLDGDRDTWTADLRQVLPGDDAKSARGPDNAEEIAKRADATRERIAQMARQAAKLRKAGNTKQAKQIVARVAQLRKKLQEAERAVRRRQEQLAASSKDDAADGPPPVLPDNSAELVEQAYLRTLSRYPTAEEVQDAVAYMETAENPRDGTRDLLWALLNTKEFIVNH